MDHDVHAELLLRNLQSAWRRSELGVPMPVTAATREVAQDPSRAAQLQPDRAAYLQKDFAPCLRRWRSVAGFKLKSESMKF